MNRIIFERLIQLIKGREWFNAVRFSFILKWQFHSKSLEKLSMNTERKIFHTITNIHCMAKVKNYHDPGECQTNEENIIGKLQVKQINELFYSSALIVIDAIKWD